MSLSRRDLIKTLRSTNSVIYFSWLLQIPKSSWFIRWSNLRDNGHFIKILYLLMISSFIKLVFRFKNRFLSKFYAPKSMKLIEKTSSVFSWNCGQFLWNVLFKQLFFVINHASAILQNFLKYKLFFFHILLTHILTQIQISGHTALFYFK